MSDKHTAAASGTVAFRRSPTELSLKTGAPFNREILIRLHGSYLSIGVFSIPADDATRVQMLAWMTEQFHLVRLVFSEPETPDFGQSNVVLWAGLAAFDVSVEEGRQIRALLEPHGLNVAEWCKPVDAITH